MKFYSVEVEEREELGSYTLLRYRWTDEPVEPGQFVMARAAGYPTTLDPFLARPFSFYDYDGKTASLLFEVRGRGTALLDLA
jgi:dihydroorotate dehydrogenase electron transfer subunit